MCFLVAFESYSLFSIHMFVYVVGEGKRGNGREGRGGVGIVMVRGNLATINRQWKTRNFADN